MAESINKFGFVELLMKGDTLYFLLDDLEGLQVNFLNSHPNLYNKKLPPIINRKALPSIKSGVREGRKTKMYSITIGNEAIEIVSADDKSILKLNHGKLEWRKNGEHVMWENDDYNNK